MTLSSGDVNLVVAFVMINDQQMKRGREREREKVKKKNKRDNENLSNTKENKNKHEKITKNPIHKKYFFVVVFQSFKSETQKNVENLFLNSRIILEFSI